MQVGISAFATYIPSRIQSSEFLAEASGIPREVLEDKFGIMSKPWPADAASAILLERDAPRNQLFETVLLTDGSFSEDVYVTGGGTRVPLTKENFDPAMLTLEVPNPAAMKERLDKLSMRNFISTIEQSV